MFAFALTGTGSNFFDAVAKSALRLLDSGVASALPAIVDTLIATVERETDIRPGLLSQWVTIRGDVIVAQDQALSLSVFRPRQSGSVVTANARVGRGAETYRPAFIARSGVAYLRTGSSVRPIYGPSAARLIEDAAEAGPDEIRGLVAERLRRE